MCVGPVAGAGGRGAVLWFLNRDLGAAVLVPHLLLVPPMPHGRTVTGEAGNAARAAGRQLPVAC